MVPGRYRATRKTDQGQVPVEYEYGFVHKDDPYAHTVQGAVEAYKEAERLFAGAQSGLMDAVKKMHRPTVPRPESKEQARNQEPAFLDTLRNLPHGRRVEKGGADGVRGKEVPMYLSKYLTK